jgi:hypothetical protein
MADNYGPPPVLGPEHERLGVFVGKWHAEGLSYASGQDPKTPRASGVRWVSDELTEWHPGGFFVIQQEDAKTGSEPLITHAVIGYEPEMGKYVAHAFENHGHHNKYVGTVDGRIWTFKGERERVRIEFSQDGDKQTVAWEWRPHDDEWLPLCDRTNVRLG